MKLKNKRDTIGSIYGLNPFIYSFRNDSLKLFFFKKATYKIPFDFKTITVSYEVLNSDEFLNITEQAFDGGMFYSIPQQKKIKYPKDMPLP